MAVPSLGRAWSGFPLDILPCLHQNTTYAEDVSVSNLSDQEPTKVKKHACMAGWYNNTYAAHDDEESVSNGHEREQKHGASHTS